MSHQVRTNRALTHLPSGSGTDTQRIEATNTVVTLSDAEFARIPSTYFSNGTLTDLGAVANPGDNVYTQTTAPAAPAALTAPADLGAAYSQANVNALRADVLALSTVVTNLVNALKGTGKPLI